MAAEATGDCAQQLQRVGALNLQNLLAIKESGQAIDSVPIETRNTIYAEEVRTCSCCRKSKIWISI